MLIKFNVNWVKVSNGSFQNLYNTYEMSEGKEIYFSFFFLFENPNPKWIHKNVNLNPKRIQKIWRLIRVQCVYKYSSTS